MKSVKFAKPCVNDRCVNLGLPRVSYRCDSAFLKEGWYFIIVKPNIPTTTTRLLIESDDCCYGGLAVKARDFSHGETLPRSAAFYIQPYLDGYVVQSHRGNYLYQSMDICGQDRNQIIETHESLNRSILYIREPFQRVYTLEAWNAHKVFVSNHQFPDSDGFVVKAGPCSDETQTVFQMYFIQ